MTEISRGRNEMPGGHKDYLDRSRSRDLVVGRGEEYGRRGRDERRDRDQDRDKDPKIRGKEDTPAGAGPEKEMHGGRGGGGY